MIPRAAVPKWCDLGIVLNISGDDLDIIEDNVTKSDCISSTKRMLRPWLQSSGKADELINAIDSSGHNAFAATLKAS